MWDALFIFDNSKSKTQIEYDYERTDRFHNTAVFSCNNIYGRRVRKEEAEYDANFSEKHARENRCLLFEKVCVELSSSCLLAPQQSVI